MWFQIFFAGLWNEFWHLSLAGMLIVSALAWAYFMPIYKTTALVVAVVVGLTTIAYVVGVTDESKRCHAQWDATIKKDVSDAEKERKAIDSAPPSVDDRSLCNDTDNRNRANCKL